MSNTIKTEIAIPDNWYDFYTRLLPGTYFVTVAYLLLFKKLQFPSFQEMIILLGAAYLFGLMILPVSILLREFLSKRMDKGFSEKKDSTEKVSYIIGREKRDSLIISKMYAEEIFYWQSSLVSLILMFCYIGKNLIFDSEKYGFKEILLVIILSLSVVIYFIYLAKNTFTRAYKRAKRYEKYHQIRNIEYVHD